MKIKTLLSAITLASSVATTASAQIYEADFTIAGQGATHSGSGSFTADTFDGANWVSSWPNVSTDGSTNSFITSGGAMFVSDWGGNGKLTSDPINITSDGTFTYSGTAVTVSSGDAFNASTEGFEWFYVINSGSEVAFGGQGQGFGGANIGNGVDLSSSVSTISVSGGDTLNVGFNFNVNGANDGFNVTAMTVSFAPVPEPNSYALLAGMFALASVMLRRRSVK